MIVVTVGAALALGAAWTWLQHPKYEGETTLRFLESSPVGRPLDAIGALVGLGNVQQSSVDLAIPILSSRFIAESLVDSLQLQVRLLDPPIARDQLLTVHDVSRTARGGEYKLRRAADGRYGIEGANDAKFVSAGETFRLGGATLSLRESDLAELPESIRIGVLPYRSAVSQLRRNLQVANGGAQVASIRYLSTDPGFAADVPNTLASNFIQYLRQTGATESRSSVAFLREQVATYRQELQRAELQLEQFQKRAQVVRPSEEASGMVSRLADLRVRRDEIIAEREALTALLDQTSTAGEDQTAVYRRLASFPVFFSNSAIQGILQSLIQLENRRADLLVEFTPQTNEVRAVTERIQDLERQLYEMARSYLQSRTIQLNALNQGLAEFSAEAQRVPERDLAYVRLQREVELLDELYSMLQMRLKEAEITGASDPVSVRVLDAALVPLEPTLPRPLLNFGLALLLGLIMATGLVFLREVTDTKVRDAADLWDVATGVQLLGAIPALPEQRPTRMIARSSRDNGSGAAYLVTRLAPGSGAAEAFRALRTNLTLSDPEWIGSRVLVVTSPMRGDGKTTTVANLSISLAQQGTRTVLVDCDLREGALHRLLESTEGPGLAEVLSGEIGLADAIQQVDTGAPVGNYLSFLAAGNLPVNPAELAGSPAMRALLQELRKEYELVILDAPPLKMVTDAAVLSTLSDGVVLVARAGTTDKEDLQDAMWQLEQLGVAVHGIVLAGADIRSDIAAYGRQVRSQRRLS